MVPRDEDEPDELETAQADVAHWRSAYWAAVRAEQLAEDRDGRGFGGNYRAVPNPQGGARSVLPQDTTGSYNFCWCGLPADHDWPGKDHGRRHPATISTRPTESPVTAQPEAPRIERKHLRTYHEELIDVIIRAVNDYGVRYRLSNNGCILYPPDGTQPYTIYARNSDRQVRGARKWFIDHVVADDAKVAIIKDPTVLATDMDMRERARELAEKLNSEEHETSDQRRARKARERQERAEQMEAEAAARAETVEKAAGRTKRVEVFPGAPELPPGNWVNFKSQKGDTNPNFAINDEGTIRCLHCGWATHQAKALGGHYVTHHSPEHQKKMWSPEARVKAIDTKRTNDVRTAVEEAIATLQAAIGQQPSPALEALNQRVTDLTKQLNQSQAELTAALQGRDEAIKERDEVKARLDLLREALSA